MSSINLPALHSGQQSIIDEVEDTGAKNVILRCGRRFGKSELFNYKVAQTIKKSLDTGVAHSIGYFAPTYKNLLPSWDRFNLLFDKVITHRDSQNYSVKLLQDIFDGDEDSTDPMRKPLKVEFWSLDKAVVMRGREYGLAFIDEAAYVNKLRANVQLVIDPTLLTMNGDLWMASTPNGYNDFHHYCQFAKNPLFSDWAHFHRKTSDNPFIDKTWLKRKQLTCSAEEYAQEYDAKFVTVGNQQFEYEDFDIIDQLPYGVTIIEGVRYWDIANSEDGAWTASVLLLIGSDKNFYLAKPWRRKGLWTTNYQYIKKIIQSEAQFMHVFETEGVGGIAWSLAANDADLAGIRRRGTDRRFTLMKNSKLADDNAKVKRTEVWVLEAKTKKIKILKHSAAIKLREAIVTFPNGDGADWVDSVSGGFLAFAFYMDGFSQLMIKNKAEQEPSSPIEIISESELIAMRLRDGF